MNRHSPSLWQRYASYASRTSNPNRPTKVHAFAKGPPKTHAYREDTDGPTTRAREGRRLRSLRERAGIGAVSSRDKDSRPPTGRREQ